MIAFLEEFSRNNIVVIAVRQSFVLHDKGHFMDLNGKKYETAIQKEYTRIDRDWLTFHHLISIGIFLFTLAVEIALGFLIINSDMLTTSVEMYVLKFIAVPSLLNLIIVSSSAIILRAEKISQDTKIYAVSLTTALLCFVIFTVHGAFETTYIVFAAAITLTTVYAQYRVTLIVSGVSVVLLVFSELFIYWDVDKISIFDSTLRMGNFLISLSMLLALSVMTTVGVHYEKRKNNASIQLENNRMQLEKNLRLDELTGISNRRALFESLKDLEDTYRTENHVFLMVDINNFKYINDKFGHPAGDQYLIAFADILKRESEGAIAYRYGGDEFSLIFKNQPLDDVIRTCKKMQAILLDSYFDFAPNSPISASFGLCVFKPTLSITQLLIHADQALYTAKQNKDKVYVYQENINA